MTVQVGHVTTVHETMVLHRIDVSDATVLGGHVAQFVDFFATIAGQSQRYFAGRRWRNWATRKSSPLVLGEQHHVNRFAPDHARGRLISELRVVLKTQCLIEGLRGFEIDDWKIDKNHF